MDLLEAKLKSARSTGTQQSVYRILTSGLSGVSAHDEELIKALLNSRSSTLQKATVELLISRNEADRLSRIALHDWPPTAGAWQAMSCISSRQISDSLVQKRAEWAERLLNSESLELLSANARLICTQIPDLKPALIREITPLTLRTLSVFASDDDLQPLIESLLGRDDTAPLPTVLGLALTPFRLISLSGSLPDVAEQLAARHGYTYRTPLAQALPFLSAGITHVNPEMANYDPADVRDDIHLIMRRIIRASECSKGSSVEKIPDLQGSEYGTGLLYAAARELEFANLEQRRSISPFDLSLHNDIATDAVQFMHLPESLLQSRLIDDATILARQCGVPGEMLDEFLIEHAAVMLAPTVELRSEHELFLRARWSAMSVRQFWTTASFLPERLNQTRRFPAALFQVVPSSRLDVSADTPDRPRLSRSEISPLLSPCATAVSRLAEIFVPRERLFDLRESLQVAETEARDLLCPIGVEVQMPLVNDNRHVAWKEVFRSVGIESRRRPECGKMLEASLPPAASVEAIETFIRLIIEFGVVEAEQDLGIHVSLQGQIGDEVRYLAFPQLFLNNSIRREHRPRDSMRLVMSKGFVHVNDDAISCSWYESSAFRTELRVFVAGILETADGLMPDESLIQSMRETHLIGSAMLSQDSMLQYIASQYASEMESCVAGFPVAFTELLAADYFQSTGNARDTSLLSYLPVMKTRDAVREVSDPSCIQTLRYKLSEIRRRAAEMVRKSATQLRE